ncbi:MAG: alpha-glucosidase C-terminal domain-containing protein, partial [Geminicoccales bacterium]
DYLWSYYASDGRARINLGIRRRLAPLLDNDRRKIELLNSLLMSMPGTPIIYYGDEIGMGDNIFLGDRDGVRTPMQWSPDRNAGFSRADSARLYLPPVTDPVYGYEAVNVEAQNRSRSSLLNWMKRLIAARKQHLGFGRGNLTFLYPGNRKVLAYMREYEGSTLLCVANLSRAAQPVELDLSRFDGRIPVELLGNSSFPPIGELPYLLTLPSYGFYWFLLASEAEAPKWHRTAPTITEPVTLVLTQGAQTLLRGPIRQQLEERIIPDYLAPRRWLATKSDRIVGARLMPLAELAPGRPLMLMSVVSLSLERDAGPELYAFPLAIAWEERDDHLTQLTSCTLARVRQGAKLGVLVDAMGDDRFVREIVTAMAEHRRVATEDGGVLAFAATSAMRQGLDFTGLEIDRAAREQSNSSLRVGDDMMLKLYRRLQPGIHPELEVTRYLTEIVQYPHTPALLGAVELETPDGEPVALAALSAYVLNQGDGWSLTLDYLGRFVEEADLLPAEALGDAADRHDAYLARVRTLGRRTAELHQALARPTDDPAFAPEPVKRRDVAEWRAQVLRQARGALGALRRVEPTLPPEARDQARRLLRRRQMVLDRIKRTLPGDVEAMKSRHPGDLHLGQVLVVQDDVMIIDVEGEPARP